MRIARHGAALLGLAAFAALPASAQRQVGIKPGFSDATGRPAVFNVQFPDAAPLQPAAVDARTVATEFKRLCLDTGLDAARIDAAAAVSGLGLVRTPLRFSGDRNTDSFEFDGWHGHSADVRIWTGDPRAFRKLPFFVVDSGVVITGPMNNLPPQCNLDLASTLLADFDALVAALTDAMSSPPSKAKRSKKWGQATWSLAGSEGPTVVGLRVDGLNKQSQTLHLGVVKSSKAP